jgi:hypothetical protein
MKTVLATTLSILAASFAVAATASGPSVRLVDRAPLTLRGAGFVPGERLTVTISAHGQRTRHPDATSTGRFTVALQGVSLGACEVLVVRVAGAAGDRAALRLRPECMSQ